jgi:predicted PurR-regulated permease PerM
MYTNQYNEKRIKRLEVTVVILAALLLISVFATVYSAIQIKTVVSSIPNYKEIKEDIKTLNAIYKVSEVKIPKAYNYTKEKAVNGYDYASDKASDLLNYIKEKTNEPKVPKGDSK